jgi:hypothetical protein
VARTQPGNPEPDLHSPAARWTRDRIVQLPARIQHHERRIRLETVVQFLEGIHDVGRAAET